MWKAKCGRHPFLYLLKWGGRRPCRVDSTLSNNPLFPTPAAIQNPPSLNSKPSPPLLLQTPKLFRPKLLAGTIKALAFPLLQHLPAFPAFFFFSFFVTFPTRVRRKGARSKCGRCIIHALLTGSPLRTWKLIYTMPMPSSVCRAAAIPKAYGGACLQMRLSYGPFAPFFLFLIQWLDCSCTDPLSSYLGLLHILIYKVCVDGKTTLSSHERKASIKDFYAIIYPSLRQLEGHLVEVEGSKRLVQCANMFSRKRKDERGKQLSSDMEREDECGICMETCTKMVLPNCGHNMCINCYHDWNTRSQSCPFCRGSLKRVNSQDLWVLTSNLDVVDMATVAKDNLRRFYIYIDNLPLIVPETLFFVYDFII